MTVPGDKTSISLYFCFIDNESFPVGIFIPKSIAKFEHAFTASYRRLSSPGLLQGHIQFAESETDLIDLESGAQIIFVSALEIATLDPADGLIKATTGA